MSNLMKKEARLQELLKQKQKIIIAFSGGVDSTYLLALASSTPGVDFIAVTAKSALHMTREGNFAEEFSANLGVKHLLFEIPLLDYKEVSSNPTDRCYHCKKAIFTFIKERCVDHQDYLIADGTNTDDFQDYRPGLIACDEMDIWHPLAEAGLSKSEIRELSSLRNLPTASKPSFACLASRIPYDTALTEINLNQVEKAENLLEDWGFKQYRVRHHGDIARIELDESDFLKIINSDMRHQVVTRLKELGFTYITLDLKGYKQGSMNAHVLK